MILTQLAGNAFNRVTPGGGATGTALQARMLADAGFDLTAAATAVTVQSLLVTGALVALPVLVVPGVLTGTVLPDSLVQAAWVGIAVFVVMAALGTLLLATRRPVEAIGECCQAVARGPAGRRGSHGNGAWLLIGRWR